MLLRYMLAADVDRTGFMARVDGISDVKTKSNAMTLAQQIHQAGQVEGKLEGALASRRQDVVEVLELRFGMVPSGLREAILAVQDGEHLRALHRAAVVSVSLEIFAQSL